MFNFLLFIGWLVIVLLAVFAVFTIIMVAGMVQDVLSEQRSNHALTTSYFAALTERFNAIDEALKSLDNQMYNARKRDNVMRSSLTDVQRRIETLK